MQGDDNRCPGNTKAGAADVKRGKDYENIQGTDLRKIIQITKGDTQIHKRGGGCDLRLGRCVLFISFDYSGDYDGERIDSASCNDEYRHGKRKHRKYFAGSYSREGLQFSDLDRGQL